VAAASAPAADPAGTLIVRTTTKASWVEVVDARGQSLLARTVQPGEQLALDGTPPFKVRIGNVAATQQQIRGQPVDLGRYKATNQARLELK
jgi:cytoskeleton protein RodZ